MPNVWVIVREEIAETGEEVDALAKKDDGSPHPAFTSEKLALDYCEWLGLVFSRPLCVPVMELP